MPGIDRFENQVELVKVVEIELRKGRRRTAGEPLQVLVIGALGHVWERSSGLLLNGPDIRVQYALMGYGLRE